MNNCPCGSGNEYATCCEPIIKGRKSAETAEQMMRARYSAHVKVEIDFLYESTHPDHREGYDHKATQTWAENSEWYGLEIIETNQGGPKDKEGEVVFTARFRDKEGRRTHHERGRFTRYKGNWRFTEGEMVKPKPLTSTKIGRNDPCHCGSGLKYKKCCGK
ncbi:MAG: hypothetical protein C0616_02125 [Desulfuromonas sp.]|nr:MAG: hypothetical protein C0616_02125 [Desulfuromonas sp.]